MNGLRGRAVLGTFFHAPVCGEIETLEQRLIRISDDGIITAVLAPDDPAYQASINELGDDLARLPPGTYGLPGFVDLHVHAPQYPQLGLALDVPLEIWLGRYTFPLEAQYADLEFARERYATLVRDLLANGTTTALYFATVHLDATKLLVDICLDQGQRALVGKVVMDDPAACPEDYRDEGAAAGIAGTRALIDYVRSHPCNADRRVLPVITPRFIPSCTDEALAGLGALAQQTQCHVQTHCSESDWAHGHVLARYGRTDAEALDGFGLLTRRSILAHGNFLTGDDMERLAVRQSAIAHCALSNAYFSGAVFPLRAALERQVHVGLGTDISGGPSASMFDSCRASVQSSRLLEDGTDPALPAEERGRPGSRIDMATAFHLATTGGGVALDLPIGLFVPGYKFDAIAIDSALEAGTIRLFDEKAPREVFETILYCASKPNIVSVWVDGRAVGEG